MSKLSKLPKLMNISDARAWKEAINAYFHTKGLSSIVNGTKVEPSTASSDDAAKTPRTLRTGSVMPEFTGHTNAAKQALKEEWKEWRKREETAQGMLLQTIADDLYQDVQEFHTAAEMWTYLNELFLLDPNETNELARQAKRNLRGMQLTEHPTAAEMINHVMMYNKTWANAKATGEKEAVDVNGKPRFRGALGVMKAKESEEEV